MTLTICTEKGECFARQGLIKHGRCTILDNAQAYGYGTCPFQKPEREVTKGKVYPYDPYYGKK